MTKQRLILLVCFWTLIFLCGYAWVKKKPTPPPIVAEEFVGKKFSVKKIKVLKGDLFDISIFEKEQRFLGKLKVLATDDSKQEVLDLLHHSSDPKVLILSKGEEGQWIVEILFLNEEKEISLSDWLLEKNLIYRTNS